jgi:NAD(P)-dependent dehydrogenase (short-subunit alcohol dehydrogenase family)
VRESGGEAFAICGDVGAKEDIHRIAGAAAGLIGPIDLLIHNASTLGPVPLRPLLDMECEDFERVLQVNLLGPFRLSKAVAGNMALRERGAIVHISSDASTAAYPTWGAYGVSKAALDHLARCFASEFESTGVKFLSIDPGEMDTAMHADAIPDADKSTLARAADVAKRIVSIVERIEQVANGSRIQAMSEEGVR